MIHYSFVYIIHMKTIKLSFFVSPKEKSIGMCSYVRPSVSGVYERVMGSVS